MFRVMGSMMPYRNIAYDIYRKKFSEASAVGFLSAILFTVFCEPVRTWVDFGQKWMELSGIPFQMNIALLGFIVGYGTTKMFVLMRMQLFRMLLAYHGWMFNPKSTTTKEGQAKYPGFLQGVMKFVSAARITVNSFNDTSGVPKVLMWALMLNLLRGNGNYRTFYFEPLLPKLPIPELNNTLDRFLLSMKPLLSDDEYVELLGLTETFRVKEGPQIHNYLLQRSVDKRNWLSDIWLDLAYLSWREPSAVNVNCYALDRKSPASHDQLARASCLLYNVVGYYKDICNETLVPQYMQDLIPITMEGYKHMNCTVRIPRLGRDEIVTYENQKHVVIYRKGVYFKLDVFKTDSTGKEVQITISEINALLQNVVELADDSKDFCPVGVFTSQHRDYWTKVRERIVAIDTNKESIECLDSSIAFFVLEEDTPKSRDEEGSFTMTGTGTNRYFDKSLQYVIYANGVMCVNAEHSAGDATLPGRIWEYALAKERGVYDEEGRLPKITEAQKQKLKPPQKLDWELNNFESEITESLEHFKKLANSFDIKIITTDYGKGFMKKKRMSPDGFLQMVIQLAYFRLTGKCVKTYESASTRMYFDARTETIRPVTEASVSWCKSMNSLKATKDQKTLLLRRAINTQTKLKNEAVVGKAWDRHMCALYYVSREMGMETPALFKNKNVFMPDVLSTSQTPTKFTDVWRLESSCFGGGFSAVNPDGYGVSYIIVGEDLILFHVTANKNSSVTSTQKMSDSILDAMNEMKILLE